MDTWKGISRNPITLNKYLYAHSDPVKYVDPTGKFASLGGVSNIMGVLAASTLVSYQIGQSLASGTTGDSSYNSSQIGLLTLAAMAGPASKVYQLISSKASERDDTTVDYYRAVDTGEMVDILDCNCFRFYDAGWGIEPTAVKRFWLENGSAVTFGNKFIKGNFAGAGEDSFFVVKATVSQTADNTISSQSGGTNPGDAFIGMGRAVGLGLLPLLNFETQQHGGIQMIGEY